MVKKKLVYIDLFAFSILYHDFFSQIVYVTSKKVNVAHLKKKCCDRFENRKIDQTISTFFFGRLVTELHETTDNVSLSLLILFFDLIGDHFLLF